MLLISNIFFQEIGILYRFSAGDKIYEWKHYGNQETDPKFMGEIKDGSPDGFGIEINPDGFIYKGEFSEGKWGGKATPEFSPARHATVGQSAPSSQRAHRATAQMYRASCWPPSAAPAQMNPSTLLPTSTR